jgi:hypothetical protein
MHNFVPPVIDNVSGMLREYQAHHDPVCGRESLGLI